jgi:hypothetical protein
MIPGTAVFQGMIRILYGIHVDKSIPTQFHDEYSRLRDVPLRSWIADNWRDPVFDELPLGSVGHDQIWQMLEQNRYVQSDGKGDYIYASPSNEEIETVQNLFYSNILLLTNLLYGDANEDYRQQSAAYLQRIAERFENCWLSPELAKLTLKQYFLYLAKGIPTVVSVMLQFLFLWDHALDREAYKAFGGTPGSEEVGRGLLLYQARVKCIQFILTELGYLVANPEHTLEMCDRLYEIEAKYNEYVQHINQPGTLEDVMRNLDSIYELRFHVEISDSGDATLLEQVRRATPALLSIPDNYLLVTSIDTQRTYMDDGISLELENPLATQSIVGAEIAPLFGFRFFSKLSSSYLKQSHLDCVGDAANDDLNEDNSTGNSTC